ncbi:hypothetical protein HY312_03800 [Candidatus Saccharibacteria bacterium]|nr:hypothetical protein [Candidatus Saccharibacteria bacterium]
MSVFSQLAQSSAYYEQSATPNDDAAVYVMLIFLFFFVVISIISYVVYSLLLGRIFKKAGVEQWIAWVPFYNFWKTLELGGQQGFWAVLLVIPFVNIVASIFLYIAMYNIGLKLQKEGWFVLFAIFLPIVWYAWLALDSSKWNEKGGTLPSRATSKI